MIVTVTPNPSLDRTVSVPRLVVGQVLRAGQVHLDPGGKGVNVSKALAAAKADTVAVLPAGGPEGARLTELLTPEGVPTATVPIAGATRVNITVVEADGRTTKINAAGPDLSGDETEALLRAATEFVSTATWLVGCGSLPGGVGDDFYARLVRAAVAAGVPVAVDSSGRALAEACAAGPDLIKPNAAELAELVGRPLPLLGDVLAAAQEVRAMGVGAVLATLGGYGALLVDETGAWHAVGPRVEVRSTVGAGDAALAGFLHAGGTGITRGQRPHHGRGQHTALRTAVAYGTAAALLPGSRMPVKGETRPDLVRVVDVDESLTLTGAAA